MEFKVNQKLLQKALSHAQNIVDKKNSNEILSHIKLEILDNKLIINGTDMDIDICESIDLVSSSQNGSLTVDAHKLYDIIKKLPDNSEINFNQEGAILKITCGKGKYNLSTRDSKEFPNIAKGESQSVFSMSKKDFLSLITKTQISISTDEGRYYLNGIYIHVDTKDDNSKVLKSVSTDGHRLTTIDIPLPNGAENFEPLILPKKTVLELSKILNKEGDMQISISKSRISFDFDEISINSKLIDGNFPEYKKVIPSHNSYISVNKNALFASVDRVSAILEEKNQVIRLNINPNTLEIITQTSKDDAKEEIVISDVAKNTELGFNFKYLTDTLNQIDSEEILIHYDSNDLPVLIKTKDKAEDNELYVLMPMRF